MVYIKSSEKWVMQLRRDPKSGKMYKTPIKRDSASHKFRSDMNDALSRKQKEIRRTGS